MLRYGMPVLALLAVAAPLAAQRPFQGPRWPGDPKPTGRRALPVVTADLQQLGVPATQVDGVVRMARERGLEDPDIADLLEDEITRIQNGEPGSQFGQVVRGLVQQGLRGPELADAIRQERAARGHGPPAGRGRPHGPPPRRGRGR